MFGPQTTVMPTVVTQRRGGQYEAAGFALILLGIGLFFTAGTTVGGLMCMGGLVVFVVGRCL